MTIDEANQLVVKRILDSQPILVGIAPAAEMIPGHGTKAPPRARPKLPRLVRLESPLRPQPR